MGSCVEVFLTEILKITCLVDKSHVHQSKRSVIRALASISLPKAGWVQVRAVQDCKGDCHALQHKLAHALHTSVQHHCRLHAAWGVTICRSILPFARGCRVGVWFGFVRAALLPAVGTCVVLAFGAMPGRCCFLRVTLSQAMPAHGFVLPVSWSCSGPESG